LRGDLFLAAEGQATVKKRKKLESAAIANALQLAAAAGPAMHVAPVLIHLNYDAHATFKVAQPIHCRLVAFLLLIRDVAL